MISDRDAKDSFFSADEMSAIFKCTSNETTGFKGESCSGGKHSREYITLLVRANMDGSEKLPLLMIRKPANPQEISESKQISLYVY